MNNSATCPRCAVNLLEKEVNSPDPVPCSNCGKEIWVHVFPAFSRALTGGGVGQTLIEEGQSSCFFHPQKASVCVCEMCGRFLCALCDMDLNGQHLCPTCLEVGKQKGSLTQLQNKTRRYDGVVMAIALVPILVSAMFPPITLISAPIGLGMGIYYWKQTKSILGFARVRLLIAMGICLLQIVAWTIAGLYFFTR